MKKLITLGILFCFILSAGSVYASEPLVMINVENVPNYDVTVEEGQFIETYIFGNEQGTIEVEGYSKNKGCFDEESMMVDGTTLLTVTTENNVEPRQGYTRTKNPVYGISSDYTVKQGSKKHNIVVEADLAKLTVLILAKLVAPYAGELASFVAEQLIDSLLDSQVAKNPTIYLQEFQLGHKTLPSLYHRYNQYWFKMSDYTDVQASSTVYDFWS